MNFNIADKSILRILFRKMPGLRGRRAVRLFMVCFISVVVIGMTLASAIVVGDSVPDFGDAPEGALAYPSSGVIGTFPTCGMSYFVAHGFTDPPIACFGLMVDFEFDGNAGICPNFNPNQYDQDECFNDGDAGLIKPEPYTIQGAVGSEAVVPCPAGNGTALGNTCQQAKWGTDIDILVHKKIVSSDYDFVNVLVDWNQDGQWGGASTCPGGASASEHVLQNFPVPKGHNGPLSALGPADFTIGPNSGYVWARFSIGERPVDPDWNGDGGFEYGESEDYLLRVDELSLPVGGGAMPVNRIAMLTPWLVIAALVAAAVIVVLKKRLI